MKCPGLGAPLIDCTDRLLLGKNQANTSIQEDAMESVTREANNSLVARVAVLEEKEQARTEAEELSARMWEAAIISGKRWQESQDSKSLPMASSI